MKTYVLQVRSGDPSDFISVHATLDEALAEAMDYDLSFVEMAMNEAGDTFVGYALRHSVEQDIAGWIYPREV